MTAATSFSQSWLPLLSGLHLVLALGLACLAGPLVAQTGSDYPNRTIRIIVPFAPGGPVESCGNSHGHSHSQGFR